MKDNIEPYINYLKRQDRALNTIKRYQMALDTFVGYCTAQKINSLDRVDRALIESYMDRLKDKGRATSTIANNTVIVKQWLNFLADRGVVIGDYQKVKVPQAPKPDFVVLQEQDVLAIADGAKVDKRVLPIRAKRNVSIIMCLATSGMRVSELSHLKRQDMSVSNGITSFVVLGKGNKKRTCRINEEAKRLLDIYLSYRDDNNPYLFCSHNKKGEVIDRLKIPSIYRMIVKYADEAGYSGVSPHTLRHYFATESARRGVSTSVIQKMCGHKNLATTQIYQNLVDTDIDKVYKEMW